MSDSWEQLRQHSEWSDAAWIAFLFTSSSAEARGLERKMRDWLGKRGLTQRILRPKTPQALREALSFLLAAPGEDVGCTWIEAVHIDVPTPDGTPPGPWTEAWDSLMLRANTRREQIMKNLRGGLILVGVPERKPRIREAAPDLWSVRALVLQPEPTPVEGPALAPRRGGRLSPAGPEDADAARAALARATELAERSTESLDGAARASVRRTQILASSRAIEAILSQGWVTEASPLAEELLQLAIDHHDSNPGRRQQTWLANAWEYQATILRDQGDMTGAREALMASLTHRKALVEVPLPKRNQRRSDLARTWSLIGGLALDRGDPEEALHALHSARDLRVELVEYSDDPESISELALSHSLLGDLHLSRGELRAARQCFEDALEFRRQLAGSHNAHRFVRYLSVAWGRLGLVSHRLGNLALARAAYQEAWSLARGLCETDPGNVAWQMEASVAASRWADLALADQELDLAEDAFANSLEIRERLVAEDPENHRWQEYLAVGLGRMSKISRARADYHGAVHYAVRAAGLSDALAEASPDSARAHRGRGTAWLRLLDLYQASGDASNAAGARASVEDTVSQLERIGAGSQVAAIVAALEPFAVEIDDR